MDMNCWISIIGYSWDIMVIVVDWLMVYEHPPYQKKIMIPTFNVNHDDSSHAMKLWLTSQLTAANVKRGWPDWKYWTGHPISRDWHGVAPLGSLMNVRGRGKFWLIWCQCHWVDFFKRTCWSIGLHIASHIVLICLDIWYTGWWFGTCFYFPIYWE